MNNQQKSISGNTTGLETVLHTYILGPNGKIISWLGSSLAECRPLIQRVVRPLPSAKLLYLRCSIRRWCTVNLVYFHFFFKYLVDKHIFTTDLLARVFMVVVAVFALSRSTGTTGLGTANAAEMLALANPE
jgi:hypothetical protein